MILCTDPLTLRFLFLGLQVSNIIQLVFLQKKSVIKMQEV